MPNAGSSKRSLEEVSLLSEELFRKYVHAGAIRRDADAVAALFAEDGVFEAPLVPLRLVGRDAIRAGIGEIQRASAVEGPVDLSRSGYVLHETGDPGVFVAEIDTVFEDGTAVALVQIFRVRDGLITLLRDYFRAP
ncbi:nuclear transport factor 2 family protein [Actinoplanes sp. NPDC048988]|uniref:nuclear transport factor 2 family protein n=1 Tax=Actinoplanes sp. NPDC048988 TaxID=3363901 RepID=UPI00371D4A92